MRKLRTRNRSSTESSAESSTESTDSACAEWRTEARAEAGAKTGLRPHDKAVRALAPVWTLVWALALAGAGITAAGPAAAGPQVAEVNGSATPGDFVFGPANIGWLWTAPLSFVWDGLGSSFHSCCQFNVLSPSQAVLTIADGVPALGGSTLYTGAVDGSGHAVVNNLVVSAGSTYFIGYSNLTGAGNFAVGVNIANWVPAQAPGTVNLSGWYTGNNFETFIGASSVNGVQQQPFSAPILRFEGLVFAVPEPASALLLATGLLLLAAGRYAALKRR